MSPILLYPLGLALLPCWLLWCVPVQATSVQDGGINRKGAIATTKGATAGRSTYTGRAAASGSDQTQRNETIARDFAVQYLRQWSSPKGAAPASAGPFYASAITFHGQRRTLASVLAEKRRFAARWPHRTYRHRLETTQVACDNHALRCTVQSSFDFISLNPRQNRRAEGIGEHQLVVSFAKSEPVIEAEDSRVVIRGHGNMTSLLDDKF